MVRFRRIILRNLGITIHIPGLMALASVPVAILFDESYAIVPFLALALISFALGQGLFHAFRDAEVMRQPHAILTAALSWAVVPLLSAIPIFLISRHLSADPQTPQTILHFHHPLNALFEAFSGFTSTGLTMAVRPSELPRSLQWWRSFMEWVGGVGVIVLMLAVLAPSTPRQLFQAEARERRIWPSINNTVRTIWWIYLGFTAVSILALWVTGMDWWAALNHGMTAISTGGFAITDNSMAAYSPAVQAVVIVIMTVGAISFGIHHALLRDRDFKKLWGTVQPRALFLLLGGGLLLLGFEQWYFAGDPRWWPSLFQWVSALGTCGFETADLSEWPLATTLLLTAGMVIGGSAGSTAGGLKVIRAVTLVRGVIWHFQRVVSPSHRVLLFRLEEDYMTREEASRRVEEAGMLAILWLTLIGLGTLVLLHIVPSTFTLSQVVFEVTSALGSVGLSVGISHPDLAPLGKLILILYMWMGRLEIIPVLLLFNFSLIRA